MSIRLAQGRGNLCEEHFSACESFLAFYLPALVCKCAIRFLSNVGWLSNCDNFGKVIVNNVVIVSWIFFVGDVDIFLNTYPHNVSTVGKTLQTRPRTLILISSYSLFFLSPKNSFRVLRFGLNSLCVYLCFLWSRFSCVKPAYSDLGLFSSYALLVSFILTNDCIFIFYITILMSISY